RIGPMRTTSGSMLDADASLENEPGFLFDGLVLPDGAEAVAALAQDGHTAEFIKDQFRHCKTILVLGESRALLAQAGVPVSMDKSQAQGGTGLILADTDNVDKAAGIFMQALARHRHFGREMDPPAV
nr:catalase HPII [Pseudomonadota bacterium]